MSIDLYHRPRTGVFRLENGHARELKSVRIIGEEDDTYITELRRSGHGEWIGDVVAERRYTLALGVHKSRLVGWVGDQIELFKH